MLNLVKDISTIGRVADFRSRGSTPADGNIGAEERRNKEAGTRTEEGDAFGKETADLHS
jgi:hypothetical protein